MKGLLVGTIRTHWGL